MAIGVRGGGIRTPGPVNRPGEVMRAKSAERLPAEEPQVQPQAPVREPASQAAVEGSRQVNRASEAALRQRLDTAQAHRDETVKAAEADGRVTTQETAGIHRADADVAHAQLELDQARQANRVDAAHADGRVTAAERSSIDGGQREVALAQDRAALADARVNLDEVRARVGNRPTGMERLELRAARADTRALEAKVALGTRTPTAQETSQLHRLEARAAHATQALEQARFDRTVGGAVADGKVSDTEQAGINSAGRTLNLANREAELADARVTLDRARTHAAESPSMLAKMDVRSAEIRVRSLEAVVDQLRGQQAGVEPATQGAPQPLTRPEDPDAPRVVAAAAKRHPVGSGVRMPKTPPRTGGTLA
ncbi:MAG: hypothetical protein HY904_12225 [Deltaproteobacteria bacterium]|nr:hypothetical protein [Deltaproteobacteria bacterium]